jgi:flagellum-specific peptidoglycan hydrolase FlgJ
MWKYNSEKLAYEKVNIRKYIGMIVLSFLTIFILSSFIWKEVVVVQAEKEVVIKTNEDFTKEKFLKEIEKYSFKYPDIIIAQALVESSHFKSPVFIENNNMFGMREAKIRISTSKGSNLNHAYYINWKDCIVDRALYEAQYLSKLSREDYFKYLDKTYAEGKDYSNLLKKVIKNNEL